MYKFLYGLVLFFILCLGIGVYGTLYPSAPHAYEDPSVTATKACYQKHERFLHHATEADKGDLMWWCIRQQYRIN